LRGKPVKKKEKDNPQPNFTPPSRYVVTTGDGGKKNDPPGTRKSLKLWHGVLPYQPPFGALKNSYLVCSRANEAVNNRQLTIPLAVRVSKEKKKHAHKVFATVENTKNEGKIKAIGSLKKPIGRSNGKHPVTRLCSRLNGGEKKVFKQSFPRQKGNKHLVKGLERNVWGIMRLIFEDAR